MAASCGWADAPATITLTPGSVHVWLAFCDPRESAEHRACALSDDERARASRFVFLPDRRRFIAARTMLRVLLGAYVNAPANLLTFDYGSHGKPALGGEWAGALDFNMSHSAEAIVVAVSSAGPVGVDIEAIRALSDRDAMASWTFARGEYERLLALSDDVRDQAFFDCWARKEAFIKAVGEGLSYPLDEFEVSFGPSVPTRLLHIAGDAAAAAQWTLVALPLTAGFAGALAVGGRAAMSCFRWDPNHVPHVAEQRHERCIA